MTPQQESTKDWLGHEIQDTVKDGFRVGSNNITALRKSPCDGVEEPKEDGPDAANEISPRDVRADGCSVLARGPGNGPSNPEEGNAAEGEVAPLVNMSATFEHSKCARRTL